MEWKKELLMVGLMVEKLDWLASMTVAQKADWKAAASVLIVVVQTAALMVEKKADELAVAMADH